VLREKVILPGGIGRIDLKKDRKGTRNVFSCFSQLLLLVLLVAVLLLLLLLVPLVFLVLLVSVGGGDSGGGSGGGGVIAAGSAAIAGTLARPVRNCQPTRFLA
jgi:hypothetical protein